MIKEWDSKDKKNEVRSLKVLAETIYWCNDDCDSASGSGSGNGSAANAVLAWHGTRFERVPSICQHGFINLSQSTFPAVTNKDNQDASETIPITKRDVGWYGDGIYFTQMPNYGQFYINHCLESDNKEGEPIQLLLSWVLLGNPYPLTHKLVNRDGATSLGCMLGYDSHFVLVNGFDPCLDDEEPTGDEIVVFNGAQVLPRYIVKYEVKKKAKFRPLDLLDSSDDEEDENGETERNGLTLSLSGEIERSEQKEENTGESHQHGYLFEGRAKAFVLENGNWKERGLGELVVTVGKSLSPSAIITLRLDGTRIVTVSVGVFGLTSTQQSTATSIHLTSLQTDQDSHTKPITYLFRFKTESEAKEFFQTVCTYQKIAASIS